MATHMHFGKGEAHHYEILDASRERTACKAFEKKYGIVNGIPSGAKILKVTLIPHMPDKLKHMRDSADARHTELHLPKKPGEWAHSTVNEVLDSTNVDPEILKMMGGEALMLVDRIPDTTEGGVTGQYFPDMGMRSTPRDRYDLYTDADIDQGKTLHDRTLTEGNVGKELENAMDLLVLLVSSSETPDRKVEKRLGPRKLVVETGTRVDPNDELVELVRRNAGKRLIA